MFAINTGAFSSLLCFSLRSCVLGNGMIPMHANRNVQRTCRAFFLLKLCGHGFVVGGVCSVELKKEIALGNDASASFILQGSAWTNSAGCCVFRAAWSHCWQSHQASQIFPWSLESAGRKNVCALHPQRQRYTGQQRLRRAERAKATKTGKGRISSASYLYVRFHPKQSWAKWACSSVVTGALAFLCAGLWVSLALCLQQLPSYFNDPICFIPFFFKD